MDNQQPQQMSVPTDAVLGVVAGQRNSALDELAKAQVVVEQLVAERDRLATEVERLRGQNNTGGVEEQ